MKAGLLMARKDAITAQLIAAQLAQPPTDEELIYVQY